MSAVDPHGKLNGVHPDLVKVILGASQSPQEFQVVYGLRSLVEEEQAVATHHSLTLHSRHLAQASEDGYACAVDVAAVINGQLSWAPGRESDVFGQIADQIQAASDAFGIDLQWGGDPVGAWADGVVSTFRDWGHFQLDPKSYP